MNKKIWVGVYIASFALFVLALITVGLILLLQIDEVYKFTPNTLIGIFGFGILMYLQFVLVQTVYNFVILAKMWGSIQDGVNPVTVGKAIGFSFIPFFNLYWIFVAWGSFPTHYNDFIQRHKLNAAHLSGGVFSVFPILILLTGILLLPVLAMPIVFAFVIAETCDAVNQIKLATDDKHKNIVQPSRQEARAQTPKSKLVPATIGGIAIFAFLFFSAFSVFAFRNLNPKATDTELPETVGKFKKDYSHARGSIFGLRSEYSGRYKLADAAKTATDGIDYRMLDFTREADAVARLKQWSFCSTVSMKKEGAIKDKNGSQIGDFMICDGKNFYFRTKNKFVSLNGGYGKIVSDEVLQFFTNLPYNADIDAEGLIAATKSTSLSPSKTQTGGSPTIPGSGDKADIVLTAEDFYKESNGANAAKNKDKYAGKIVEISGRFYPLSVGSDTATLHAGKNALHLKITDASRSSVTQLKAEERVVFKCRGAGSSYRPELENCVLAETKGVFSPDEKPDYVFSAKDYFNEVDGDQSYEAKSKKQEMYAGKIIELSGKVKVIGNDKQYLEVADMKWITCEPNKENVAQFSALAAGQDVKFKGLGSRYGSRLEQCQVVSQ